MSGQFLPPPDMAPSVPHGLPREEYIRMWVDWMETCDQFLLAGLRRKIGPDGDLRAAYRDWYARQMEEHDRMMLHMMEEFDRRSRSHDS